MDGSFGNLQGGVEAGVGDKSRTGSTDEPVPRVTLRVFFDYLNDIGEMYHITDWWGPSPAHKQLLAPERRAGKFGGLGVNYANYMWVQNYGNAQAKATGTHFIEKSLAEFRQAAPGIIRGYFRE